jgi:hypothetical protein
MLLGMLSAICWWQIRLLGDVRERLGAFYGWFACAFLSYLVALWLVRRAQHVASRQAYPLSLGVIVLVGAVARLAALGSPPTLSDDVYRYRWDGRVQLSGFDPYAYPPDHPSLEFLRDEEFRHINFPHLRTVYPPLAQLAFRLGASLSDTLTAQKAVCVFAEVFTGLSLLCILLWRGLSPLWVVAYAWHPLVILEIAGQGHNDALGVAGLWLGVAAWESRQRLGAALAWSAAFLSKFLSIILVPWWWFRRQARGWLVAFLALSALPLVLHWSSVEALLESLSVMRGRAASNASVYLAVMWLVGSSRIALLVVIGLWTGFLVWWAKREADPVRYLFGGLAVAALLSPALHPWYLVWLIPCFCFWRVGALLVLTGTGVLAYTVWPGYLADGRWLIPVWARLLEYAPVAILGLWEVGRCASRSSFLPATKPSLFARS